MKKDLVEILSIFDKNKTIGEILIILDKEIEITTTKQVCNNEPELVDLGLPSGNLWMKCNLGASKETDYGLYYQFGSLVGYRGTTIEHFSWKNCPFNNWKEKFDEKYFLKNKHNWFDKDDYLKPEFDAVTQTYGSDFKIPSEKDFRELLDNTTSKTIKDYENSGKNGKLFTSKINGKTLFIPYSGDVRGGSFCGVGYWSNLWSSRLHSCFPDYACYLYCDSDSADLSDRSRFYGYTIRGIKVKGN